MLTASVTGIVSVPVMAQQKTKAAPQKSKMNILYIMTDDHSYQTIGAYGAKHNKTPNIDQLAKEGVVFDRAYVANSISGPSRACMLTGKHSHKNGFINNSTVFDGEQPTFPKYLQQAGYQTAIVGKWHLSSAPTGFDYWNILVGQGDYYNPDFIDNGKAVRYHGYATTITTDLALDWLEHKRDREKPFCLLLHHKAPHRTWMPEAEELGAYDDTVFPLPPTFYDNYTGRPAAAKAEMSIDKDMDLVYDLKMLDPENEIQGHRKDLRGWASSIYRERMDAQQLKAWNAYYYPIQKEFKQLKLKGRALAEWKYQRYMRDYCSVINSVDKSIGRVINYLKEKGLLENTLIVYTSDQGFYMGEHGWFDKRFMYEESFRTPLIARLPNGTKDQRDSYLVQNIDFAPTFLELAGIPKPSDIQGVSILPLLKGEKPKEWRKSLYYHFYEYPGEHCVNRHYGVFDGRYKLIHFYNDKDVWELYDLEKDPFELQNQYRNPAYSKVLKHCLEELEKLQQQYDDHTANLQLK